MESQKSQTQQLNNNKNKWNDYQIQLAVFLKWEVFSVHKPYLVSKSIALTFCRDKFHCETPTQ